MALYWQRYGPEHDRWLKHLLDSQWYARERISKEQLKALRETVDYAFRHVPFYREAYGKLGFHLGEIRSFDDFRQLPIVNKEEVRRNPLLFVSEEFAPRRIYAGLTSGSTGTPLTLYKDRSAFQRNWAFLERTRLWYGVPSGSPRVTFWGRHVVPFKQSASPFWRHDMYINNWLFSVYHLGKENLCHYVQKIAEIQPTEIYSYPSALVHVAKKVLDLGEEKIRPKMVITSGETLLPEQRALIQQAFGCPVNDSYGAGEMVASVTQCEHQTYHNHPEYGFLETVRGSRVVFDEPGEVLGTGFLNRAMPLIRYRVGDIVTLDSAGVCSCGRAFPIVKNILGRTDDILYTPEGVPRGRLSHIFKGLQSVKEGQIIQDRKAHLQILVVAAGSVPEDTNLIRRRIDEYFGSNMKVDFETVVDIPRTASGKFRHQLNLTPKSVLKDDS